MPQEWAGWHSATWDSEVCTCGESPSHLSLQCGMCTGRPLHPPCHQSTVSSREGRGGEERKGLGKYICVCGGRCCLSVCLSVCLLTLSGSATIMCMSGRGMSGSRVIMATQSPQQQYGAYQRTLLGASSSSTWPLEHQR